LIKKKLKKIKTCFSTNQILNDKFFLKKKELTKEGEKNRNCRGECLKKKQK
jgi:hypothetical protein